MLVIRSRRGACIANIAELVAYYCMRCARDLPREPSHDSSALSAGSNLSTDQDAELPETVHFDFQQFIQPKQISRRFHRLLYFRQVARMSTTEPENATERSIPPLPAIDTSPESWRFVASAFVVECLLWGQVFSSGIFLKYLATNPVRSLLPRTWLNLTLHFRQAVLCVVGNANLPYRFPGPAVRV